MVAVYIEDKRLDLFNDEKIDINSSVKNINELDKIFTDLSKTFTIPASPTNNAIFQHWYDATIDGTFNANIQIAAYIELNTLPYRYGTIQLNECKLKNGLPESYSITFYGKTANLSQIFADDELKDLDLSDFNHEYSEDVLDSLKDDTLFSGDVFYPLINSVQEMSIGTGGATDLINSSNNIFFREFKPAIRLIRIIEAIEKKYSITFSRDFFDRAVFYNLFLLLHKDTGKIKAFGNEERIGVNDTAYVDEFSISAVNDNVTFVALESNNTAGSTSRSLRLKITPDVGFENDEYKVNLYINNVLKSTRVFKGTGYLVFPSAENNFVSNVYHATISSDAGFSFTSSYITRKRVLNTSYSNIKFYTNDAQTLDGYVNISEQMPEMKVKDFLVSLIKQFNLIIQPKSGQDFYIDTLDNWYNKGKLIDLTKYINIEDIQIKRPEVKRSIEFLYQKAGTILAEKYFDNNQIGYGDLKAKYDIVGDELKIESGFENILFERLPNEGNGELTDIQVGFLIDKNLSPYKGKPIIFYKNGFTDISNAINIQPTKTFNRVYQTGTEDNLLQEQVTSTLNFGADVSSYFLTSIERSLYFNWWKTYIEDLYNKKTRVLNLKCRIPFAILFNLKLNDKVLINDVKYKISSLNSDLTTSESTLELFSDFSKPSSSIDSFTALTVDRTDINVDRTDITVDAISLYEPIVSYITEGIDKYSYTSTAAPEHFEIKVSASSIWSVSKVDNSFGTAFVNVNKLNGNGIDYLRVSLSKNNTASYRSVILRFNISGTDHNLLIEQLP